MKQLKHNELTVKQEVFCQKVVEGFSLSDSYRDAYNTSKMKDTTINQKAYELNKNGDITVRINQLRRAGVDKHGVSVEKILNELMRVAFFDPTKLFDRYNKLIPITNLPRDVLAGISSIDIGNDENDELGYNSVKWIKTQDKLKALELIGKYFAMFTDCSVSKPSGIKEINPVRDFLLNLKQKRKSNESTFKSRETYKRNTT
ncbi:MAG: terminase small subunit [Cytophagia bacterium]|nr:terminase small subunit [Cytophagia bacterium]